MPTLRALFILAAFVVVTPAGMALQAVFLATGWREAAAELPVHYHRFLRWLLGLRVTCHGAPVPDRPLLILANHVSWLDIIVFSTVLPLSFVAKREVASWPLIGWLARLQRTIFVERGRRSRTLEVNRELGRRLAGKDVVVLFAEGTSSDGNRVLPFRSALLGSAHDLAGEGEIDSITVQPAAIAYTRLNGMPMGRQHRPAVAWHGDLELAPHLWRFLTSGTVDAEIAFGDPIELSRSSDRKQVAAAAQAEVRRMAHNLMTGRPAR